MDDLRVRETQPFKLKDSPKNRRYQFINLKNTFGFVPEVIVVEKVEGSNNKFRMKAILTEEEIKKEKLAEKKV